MRRGPPCCVPKNRQPLDEGKLMASSAGGGVPASGPWVPASGVWVPASTGGGVPPPSVTVPASVEGGGFVEPSSSYRGVSSPGLPCSDWSRPDDCLQPVHTAPV